jgi:hypothetical protein
MNAFLECPKCGSAVVITEQGLCYCPVCDPQRVAVFPVPAAARQHWGYLLGYQEHECGVARADNAFGAGGEAALCWLAGWDAAERDDIRESHREKIAGEQSFWSKEEMRNAA